MVNIELFDKKYTHKAEAFQFQSKKMQKIVDCKILHILNIHAKFAKKYFATVCCSVAYFTNNKYLHFLLYNEEKKHYTQL